MYYYNIQNGMKEAIVEFFFLNFIEIPLNIVTNNQHNY